MQQSSYYHQRISKQAGSNRMSDNDKALCIMEGVRKVYRIGEVQVDVLKDINLRVDYGEFVAIMGTSGAGKTTLMNILGCLDSPTSGRYIFNGRDVSNLSDDELSVIRNEQIGFIFQNFYLIPYATVMENVLLPTLYLEKTRRDVTKRAKEILRIVGLEEREDFRPNQISGGQQQRVAIARALINNPELLLADEPTGQLDTRTSAEIMNIIKGLNDKGMTIIVITHDPSVAAYAGRVIHIRDGVIEAS